MLTQRLLRWPNSKKTLSEDMVVLKVIYHPLYGMNNYVLIGVIGYHMTL